MNSKRHCGEWPLSGSRSHRPGALPFLLLMLVAGMLVTACGQRGPLFLPDEKSATPPAIEVEQENVENSPNLQEEEDDDEEMPGT